MTKLAIIGPGLLGGSLALAVRQFDNWRVSLWARRPEAVSELEDLKLADFASSDLSKVVADADLLIFCVPVGAMGDLARRIAPELKPSAIVTDVGSVKASVVAELESIFAGHARFVGSHPMAGSEQTGVRAARSDLFEDAACMVTPTTNSDPSAVEEVEKFWGRLGCRVSRISPAAHDEWVAAISHLPHLVAAALVNAVAEEVPEAFDVAGPGFRDTSRVAGGAPDMWAEIFQSNRSAVRKCAEAMIAKLKHFITLLDRQSPDSEVLMKEFLTQAKARRDRLPSREQRSERP